MPPPGCGPRVASQAAGAGSADSHDHRRADPITLLPWYTILSIVSVGCVVAGAAASVALRGRLRGRGSTLRSSMYRHLRLPLRVLVVIVGLEVATAAAPVPAGAARVLDQAWTVALDLAIGLGAIRVLYVCSDLLLAHFRTDIADNLQARRVATQVQVARRIAVAAVTIVAISLALLTFGPVRAAGEGLLASAGLVGIAAGLAARPILTNMLAGIQIALSQPIRVDDVVVVDGEWGRIEQIALTYVVVQIWDLRRLVLPISYFIENPFENWTRTSSRVLGWAHLELDYCASVEDLRRRFLEVLEGSPDWDRQTAVLQVTGAGTETLQVRCLMSSTDSSKSWNLQCEVREKLIAYLQDEHPEALPRLRVQLAGARGDHQG